MEEYRPILSLNPSSDDRVIPNGSTTSVEISNDIFSFMVTKSQWDNCENYKESDMNPRYSVTGYKGSYLLSEMKSAFDMGKSLYFESEKLKETDSISELVPIIDSRNITYYVNDARPNIECTLTIGKFIIDTFTTDKNGHYKGTFLIPKGMSAKYPVTAKVTMSDNSFFMCNYVSNVTKVKRQFTKRMLPIGVLVDGEFHGTKG